MKQTTVLLIIICILSFVLGGLISYIWFKPEKVIVFEGSKEIIDSITKVNNNIETKITHLNNEKSAKIKEVKHLDNDSTLKLFYELVSE